MAQKLLGGSSRNTCGVSMRDIVDGSIAELGDQSIRILVIQVPMVQINLAGTTRISLARVPTPDDLREISLTSSSADEVTDALIRATTNRFPYLCMLPSGMDRQLPPILGSFSDPVGMLVTQFGHQMTATSGTFVGEQGIACINLITASIGTALAEAEAGFEAAADAVGGAMAVISRVLPFLRDHLSRQPECLKLVRDAARVMELDNVLEHLAARLIVMETPDAEQTLDMVVTALRRVGRRRVRAAAEAAAALEAEEVHSRWVESALAGRSERRRAEVMEGAGRGRWPMPVAQPRSWRDAPDPDAAVVWASDRGSARSGPSSLSWRSPRGARAVPSRPPPRWPPKHPLKQLTGLRKELPPLMTPQRKAALERAVTGGSLIDTPGTMVFVVLVSVLVRWMRADRLRLRGQLVRDEGEASLSAPASSAAASCGIAPVASDEGADFCAESEARRALTALEAQVRLMPAAMAGGPEQDAWHLVRLLSSARLPLFDLGDDRIGELTRVAADLRAVTASSALVAGTVPGGAGAGGVGPGGLRAVAGPARAEDSPAPADPAAAAASGGTGRAWGATQTLGSRLAAQQRREAQERERRRQAEREAACASAAHAAEALARATGRSAAEATLARRVVESTVAHSLSDGHQRSRVAELSRRAQDATMSRAREILDATIGSEMRRVPGCGVESLFPRRCAASAVTRRLLGALPIVPEMPRISGERRRVCRVTAINQGAGCRRDPDPGEPAASHAAAAEASCETGGATGEVVLVPCRIGEVTGLIFDSFGEYRIAYQPLGFLCDDSHRIAAGHMSVYASASRASERRTPFLSVSCGSATTSRPSDGAQLWAEARAQGEVLRLQWSPMSEEDPDISPEQLEGWRDRYSRGGGSVLQGKLELGREGEAGSRTVYCFGRPDEAPCITLAWLSCSVSVTHTASEAAAARACCDGDAGSSDVDTARSSSGG